MWDQIADALEEVERGGLERDLAPLAVLGAPGLAVDAAAPALVLDPDHLPVEFHRRPAQVEDLAPTQAGEGGELYDLGQEDQLEQGIRMDAAKRSDLDRARRRVIEAVLLRKELLKYGPDVETNFSGWKVVVDPDRWTADRHL